MEVSAGTCIAVEVGVGGGLIHTGPHEPESEGSQTKIQSDGSGPEWLDLQCP